MAYFHEKDPKHLEFIIFTVNRFTRFNIIFMYYE